jgi:membrane fusion protein, multidrug efflux system
MMKSGTKRNRVIDPRMKVKNGRLYRLAGFFLLLLPCLPGCQKEAPPPAFPAATVLAAKSVQKEMPVAIHAIGAIEAHKSVVIYPRVGGQLLEVHFRQGQDVRRGQLLFTIDPAPYREKLRQAEGILARDLAYKTFNDQESKRYAFLFEKGAVSKSDAEKFRMDAATYEAIVQADQAAVEEARLNLEFCSIRAPLDGRAGAYSVNVGTNVKANDTALATINQIAPVFAKFSIPEKYLPDVKKYLAAGTMRVRASPAADFLKDLRTGTLVFIDNAVDVGTGMIQMKAEFPNTDRFLWPGQYVNVALELTIQHNAVVAPLRSIQMGEKGSFVFVVKPDMTIEMRPVVMDRSIWEEAVVSKGLNAGETVVTDGHLKVRPGGKVEIQDNLEASGPKAAAQAPVKGGVKP